MPQTAQNFPDIGVYDDEIDIEEIMLDCGPIMDPFDAVLRETLIEAGFRVGRIIAHPFHDIWTARISSTDNLAKDRFRVTRRIRKSLRKTWLPVAWDSITISLEGPRGVVILVMPPRYGLV
jgi:8-oxo-dGTP pyrophosphatase MutT (NUDIX family)